MPLDRQTSTSGVDVSATLGKGTHRTQPARTRIFLKFRIRGLKEDLDTVERRNDRLCLRRLQGQVAAGGAKSRCVTHDTSGDTAGDARANHLVRGFNLGIIRAHSKSMHIHARSVVDVGGVHENMLRSAGDGLRLGTDRSSCDSAPLPLPLLRRDMASKAKSDVKALKGQDGAEFPPSTFSL